ncbi:hypothetical protein DFA_09200 [Cavenderia fasciculata]|uniref:Uncharacterized protein n=1 Tax=Cavenderia fasciculata TaxID=261658 RepID=F4Q6Z0_CACFS|nr:uncharacterized protein DFA_09200 [Cavenderia fasciculata]EGG16172.1 hypothetical protein DFA_09200 [Cavenderia fasciculata]|eukprot:XP_004352625.1 hypothetical protein DFA_09200 [Cavenderia fasciculata]
MATLLHYLEYQILDHYFTDNNIFGCQDLGSAQPEYFDSNGNAVKSTSTSTSTLLYTPYNRVEVFNLNVVCKRWFGHLLKLLNDGSLESILHHSRNSLQSIQIVQTWGTVNKVLTILQQFLNPSPILKANNNNNNNQRQQNNSNNNNNDNNNLKSVYLFLTNTTIANQETKELVSGQLSNIFCQLEHSLESITLRHVTPFDTPIPQLAIESLFGHVSSNAGDEIYPNLVHLYLSGLDDTTFQYSNLDRMKSLQEINIVTRSPPTVNSRLLQYLLTTKVPRVSNTMTLTSQTIEIITTNTKVLAWTIEINFTDESILSILPFTTPSHITELKIIISKSIKPLPIVRLPTTDINYNNSPICPIRLDNKQLLKLSLELLDIDCDNGFFGFYQFHTLIGQAYNIKLLRISTKYTSWCDHGGSLFKTLIDHNPNLAALQLSSLGHQAPPLMVYTPDIENLLLQHPRLDFIGVQGLAHIFYGNHFNSLYSRYHNNGQTCFRKNISFPI